MTISLRHGQTEPLRRTKRLLGDIHMPVFQGINQQSFVSDFVPGEGGSGENVGPEETKGLAERKNGKRQAPKTFLRRVIIAFADTDYPAVPI